LVAGRKLLLADDSITIQKVVDLTFADEGMQVTTVSNGARAIEKLEEVSPDIVLVDIFMPGMSGYQVCEHIKRDERFRHIPVMLLVGSFEPFDEAEARRVGADDYLTKPFQSIRQLVNKVGALLGRDSTEDEAPTKDLSLPATVAAAAAAAPPPPPKSEMSKEKLESSTANTAPLPRHLHEALEEQQREEKRQPEGGALREALLVNTVQEDEVIEAAPQGGFTEPEMETSREDNRYAQMEETISSYPVPEKSGAAAASALAATAMSSNVMGARMAAAALSDEALLDLDDAPSSRRAAEADDFILDLQDDAFLMDSGTLEEYEEELESAAPQALAFNEAQMTTEEQRADFAPVEQSSMAMDASAESASIEAASQSVDAPAANAEAATHAQPTGQITLSQLSPEVIDAIARRAVEQISERVVEDVAWEVVPQLAELLIKRHLEREKAQTP
jgi:CheY-like chemotaxis protein